MAERAQQVRDKMTQKQAEANEEHMWAMQQEANRQMLLQNEIELDEKKKQMAQAHRTQHKADKVEKDDRWVNFYGEKNPLPDPDQY